MQSAEDGEQALELVVQAVPDAVVLDVGLPGIDGLEVCRRLRLLGNRVPILILTARDAVADRIDGLDVGRGRLHGQAVRRRRAEGAAAGAAAPLRPGLAGSGRDRFPVVRRAAARQLAARGRGRRGSFVELTRTEYQLLELLMLNPRQVLSHSLIYDRVWGYDFGPASNALRVYVGYLRRKLEDAGARQLIHTVRGVGYVLREP